MTKIIFLHIPKTAGQSVHHFFETSFPKKEIFPARVNAQLQNYTCDQMNYYKIFSGHFDWKSLECLNGEKFIFTILREPRERIFSFYLYLRSQAKKMTPDTLIMPQYQGMHAALTLSPDDYFTNKSLPIRNFIDNHYDNFYTYYFAGKSYDSRQQLANEHIDNIFSKAIANLKSLDKIYDIQNWEKLFDDIKQIYPSINIPNHKIHVNKGDLLRINDRHNILKNLGATKKTFNRIDEFCKYDNQLYREFITDIK